MEDKYIMLIKTIPNGFPKGHLLSNITTGVKYVIVGKYMKSVQILDDTGKGVWISNKLQKKFFKEIK